MTILLTNFFLCLLYAILAWFFRVRTKTRDFDKFFMAITFLQLVVVHSFIDPFSVPDLPSYYYMFFDVKEQNLSDFIIACFSMGDMVFVDIEPGYLLLTKIISLFSNNFTVFLFFVSVFIMVCYFSLFKKYSPYVFISILMLLLTTFNQSIFVLRQHIAVGLSLLAIPSVIDRKHVKFLIVIFVAFLFHRTALLFLPLYYFYGFKNNKGLIIVGMILLVLLAVFKVSLYDYLTTNIEAYSAYVNTGSIVNFLIPVSVFFVYCFVLKQNVFNKGINRIVFLCLFFSVILTFVFYNVEAIGRGILYYSVSYVLAISITMRYIKSNIYKIIYMVCVLLLFFIVNYDPDRLTYFREFQLLFI